MFTNRHVFAMDGEGRIVIQGSNIFDLLRRVPLTLFAVEDCKKIKKLFSTTKKLNFYQKGIKILSFCECISRAVAPPLCFWNFFVAPTAVS